jgi:recombination protein RecA
MVEFDILFNEGINRLGELVDMGVDKSVLRRSGTWLSYGDVRLGQGRERAREFLRDNPTVQEKLRQDVLRAHGVLPAATGKATSEEAATGKATSEEAAAGAGKAETRAENKAETAASAGGEGQPHPALQRGGAPARRAPNVKGGQRN